MKTTRLFGALGLSILMLTSTAFLTNCKKDKKTDSSTSTPTPTPTPAPTNTEKLTGKFFKVTAATVNPGINDGTTLITDWYASSYYEPCLKDNLIKFNTNGTYTEDEATVVCSGENQTTSGTWSWNSNETILTIKENGSSSGTDFTVITNDGTTLKGTVTENINGTNYVFTYTYVKQ